MAQRFNHWVSLSAIVIVAFTCGSPGQAADWSRFRGPNGSAVSEAPGVPTEWSSSKNLAWKTELPGPGSSSPIIVGDRVFVTCYSGYGTGRGAAGDITKLERHLICVSLKDGKILWNKAVATQQREESYNRMLGEHGYATSTPVSDGEHVFVYFGKAGVLAFDLDGNQLWQTLVGSGSAQNNWGSGSSPILYGKTVIVNAAAESKSLIALDQKTGKEVWRTDAASIHGSWATPVLVDAPKGKTELVMNAPYEMWGFDPDNGDFLWFAEGIQDMTICGSVVTRDGIVYAIGGRQLFEPNPAPLASKAPATRKAVTSSYGRDTTCTPVGTPFAARPDGTDSTAQRLRMLNGRVIAPRMLWLTIEPPTSIEPRYGWQAM